MDAQTGTITEEEACAVEVAQRDEVLKFMKDAIDLETDVVMQERTLELCCNEFEKRKPKLEQEKLPTESKMFRKTPALGCICIVVGLAIYFGIVGTMGFEGNGLLWLAYLLGAGFIIPGIVSIRRVVEHNAEVKRNEELFLTRTREVRTQNQKKKEAYDTAIRQCNESITALRGKMEPEIAVSKEMLEKLYGKGEIYPKYCTLPALTSIYEYFMTGRCTELTGPHGAYNLYEDEVRKDTVISQLSSVIENLEQIRNNQYMLYQQVKEINTNTSAIVSEVQKIRNNTMQIAQLTALNAYYAARNERNTRISMYYNL